MLQGEGMMLPEESGEDFSFGKASAHCFWLKTFITMFQLTHVK